MAKALVTFAFYSGEGIERRTTLGQDIIKLGTDPKCHLRVKDPRVSRMHSVIEVSSPENIVLIDLGNESGTSVNGKRVNKHRLRVGDRIQIGESVLVLQGAVAPGEEPRVGDRAGVPVAPSTLAAPRAGVAARHPFATDATRTTGGQSLFAGGITPVNPFAAGAALSLGRGTTRAAEVADDAPPGSYAYTLLKSGPEVSSEEVELLHVPSVEVMILWGANVLHVSHLTPPRSFHVGEEQGKNLACDFFIPAEKIGTTRWPVVIADRGALALVIPPSAHGHLDLPGEARISLEEARQRGQPSSELSGGHQLSFPPGAKARVEIDQFVWLVGAVNAGKPVRRGVGANRDWTAMSYFGLSLLAHSGFIAALAFFVPPLGLTEDEETNKDQLYLVQQYLNAISEREQAQRQSEQMADENRDDQEGGTGTRSTREEGSMGNPLSKAAQGRYAVQGPRDNPDPHIAHAATLREAADFGMIGLLNPGLAGDPNAPTAPWGRDGSLGTDDVSARGNMWGDEIGDAFGAGGLGLSGIGEGGGGRGEGIGLGFIGTLGHGAGTGTEQGFGPGHGRLGPGHRVRAPQVRVGQLGVSGRLPPEVIQRIVRQNFGRFKLCYQEGLTRNPNLEGRASVRFVVGRDGSVLSVADGGSDLKDSGVVGCVIRAYYGLSFPEPEGGVVTVVYPIMFAPG